MAFFPVLLSGLIGLGTLAGAWIATGLVLRILRRRAILDHPNERSSHSVPTPRGGGIAVVGVVALAWTALALAAGDGKAAWTLALGLMLAGISWFDDLRSLSVRMRFAAQAVAVSLGLLALPEGTTLFQGLLPVWMDRFAAALAWLWFINLFNFMDGIDGVAGVESASIGFGLGLLAMVGALPAPMAPYAIAIAGAAVGFLRWNWPPASVFLGDVGSVPLGYLLGWLLLVTAAKGLWIAALVLPFYYFADATLTLLIRMIRGEPVWQAHRAHFYQQGARRLTGHRPVVWRILALNVALAGLATGAATGWIAPLPALFAAGVSAGLLLWYFAERTRSVPRAG